MRSHTARFIAAAMFATSVARADGSPAPSSSPEPSAECPQPANEAAARQAAEHTFESGARDARRNDFATAAREFECSYRLLPTAQAAYNAALAMEHAGRNVEASEWFTRYLVLTPFADDRADVQRRIASHAPPSTAVRSNASPETPHPAARDNGNRGSVPLQVTGVALLVAAVDGIVLGAAMHVVGNEVDNRFQASGSMDASLQHDAQTYGTAGTVAWIASGVLLVGGVLALIGGLRSREANGHVASSDHCVRHRGARAPVDGCFE